MPLKFSALSAAATLEGRSSAAWVRLRPSKRSRRAVEFAAGEETHQDRLGLSDDTKGVARAGGGLEDLSRRVGGAGVVDEATFEDEVDLVRHVPVPWHAEPVFHARDAAVRRTEPRAALEIQEGDAAAHARHPGSRVVHSTHQLVKHLRAQ